jgi:23S rRNA (cytidine1920-2'-O)/16S rRNA (cytidine1409-2'-O)-methyltransferase
MKKIRVDTLLVERGLAESRSLAQRLVMAGQVRANGQVVLKPSSTLTADARLEVTQKPLYVSRGGEKLAAALASFQIEVKGKICADVGASTGGFTDCLLQNGAQRVYAIDVGKGILHWKLRQDPRVVVMEETNARFVERLPEPVELVTIDASFISLKILLPVVKGWLPQAFALDAVPPTAGSTPAGQVIALIKPQFEAGRSEVSRGDGVIRDPWVHKAILEELLRFAQNEGFGVQGLLRSPLLGPKGNMEFLARLSWPGQASQEIEAMIAQVV